MKYGLNALAPAAVCMAAILAAGCSATVPTVTVGPGLARSVPALLVTARPTVATPPAPRSVEARVAEIAGRYYGIEATVEGLVTDMQALDAGQAALQMDLRAIEGRIKTTESRVLSLTDQILARFDAFELQTADLQDVLTQRAVAPPLTARPASTEDVLAAVQEWRVAWQTGAVSEYMNWYHPDASVTRGSVVGATATTAAGLGLAELRDRMERLRARYTRVDVAIADVQVTHDGDRIVVRFRQDFAAWAGDPDANPSYVDTGTKTLVLVRVGDDLRVLRETWTPTL